MTGEKCHIQNFDKVIRSHIWHNHSLLRKPITNVMTQGNYVIQGSMISTLNILQSSISGGNPSAWDAGLDISTALKYGTLARRAEENLEAYKPRKRQRTELQENLAMTEMADLAFDHQRGRKSNSSRKKEKDDKTISKHQERSL